MYTPTIIISTPIPATSSSDIVDIIDSKLFQKVEFPSLKYSEDKMSWYMNLTTHEAFYGIFIYP